uniref:Serine/threonine-protein phosphatase with EF-hands n=1 Tax=Stegastes partitus TaxID=144197 RepID=A0A3B5ACF7_9TELE
MGCGVTKSDQTSPSCCLSVSAIRAAVLIQRWYRQYVARTEMRRRYTWHIFQSIEYSGESLLLLVVWIPLTTFTFLKLTSNRVDLPGNLISHIFRENEVCRDAEWERHFCYKNIEVPEIYSGPHLTFPLTVEQAVGLVEAFRNKKQLHSRYALQLLLETWKLLRMLPNINRISTCHSKEITICGERKERFLIDSREKPYVFNGDFVDRGKDSIEILLILFAFLLVYPSDVYLNRGNHEDHIVNLRYGFTKEVLTKYKMHGKRILKLLQKIFSWLPLATVIDQKVLVLHGGISDTTDLNLLARLDRHSVSSRPCDKLMSCQQPSNVCLRRGDTRAQRPRPSTRTWTRTSGGSTGSSSAEPPSPSPNPSAPATVSTTAHIQTLPPVFPVRHQVLDLLWSDPMAQDGCIPNEVRGGGCYWGPDVTEDFLNKHNLQLIIRSHECKQDGYEFCHNRKVLTLFSASNYYDVGSNRGAYVKLGPDLVPYLLQYQASSMIRELTVRQSVGRTERSALKVLREQLFAHKSDLICAFKKLDSENTGLVSLNDWASAVESVMHLDLPWRMLRCQLVTRKTSDGMIDYYDWFNELAIMGPSPGRPIRDIHLLETLYRHRSTLETIFRIVDTDNSGFITMEDFRQTWKLLSVYLKMEITEEAISDLAVTIDSNQDGSIDIDEFMEAFRLTDKKMTHTKTQDAAEQQPRGSCGIKTS